MWLVRLLGRGLLGSRISFSPFFFPWGWDGVQIGVAFWVLFFLVLNTGMKRFGF